MTDSGAMRGWYDLLLAVTPPDLPAVGRREHLARFTHPWPSTIEEVRLTSDGDRVVGAASWSMSRPHSPAHLELVVHPGYRRRGIGTALLQQVRAAVRAEIEIETVRALPGGITRDESGYRYLIGRGHRPVGTSIRSRCVLGGEATVFGVAAGYSLVQWHSAAPEEVVADLAALQGRFQQQVYDTARIRAQEQTERGRGHRVYCTAARHDATGRIVARTKLAVESDDDTHARQRITIVEPDHRGRRLGLAVKSANHAYARAHEPALRVVDSWNAEQNTHMRAVNAVLGFEPVDSWPVFRLPPEGQRGRSG